MSLTGYEYSCDERGCRQTILVGNVCELMAFGWSWDASDQTYCDQHAEDQSSEEPQRGGSDAGD